MNLIDIYLEKGKKKTFAGALDWPGWCRSGRDEESALQALLEYAPRYEHVVHTAYLGFQVPTDISDFKVIQRLDGDATTDFGAPSKAPKSDSKPIDDDELKRFQLLLQACWQALDLAMGAALGKELRKGPRGGGRDLDKMIQHVLGSDKGYLTQLGWKLKIDEGVDLKTALNQTHQAILQALASAARGELPLRGLKGGLHWTPRYFVRRTAWHVLDHAWEIEDRII